MPENFRSNDVAFELVKRGNQVDALVGIPNYPEGKYAKGYGLFRKRIETINGVNVYRVFQFPRGVRASKIGLSINYISYVFSAYFWIFFYFVFKKRYDAIFVCQLSPVTQALPAILLGKLKRVPVYTWVLDVWPDSVLSSFKGKKPIIIKKVLTGITEYVYRNSFRILVSSKGMSSLVCRNTNYANKIIYFPNWCEDILSLPKKECVKLPDGFIIMMAGNLGSGIGADALIDLFSELCYDRRIHFVLVGGGSKEEYLRKCIIERGLKNVTMTGLLPFEQMPGLYEQADAMLLSLLSTPEAHLKATVPMRLQSYMSAGKPVFGMIDGCASEVIETADCGCCVPAGAFKDLSEHIRYVVAQSADSLKEKGKNARDYFEKYYQKDHCISNLEYYLKGGKFDKPPYAVPDV